MITVRKSADRGYFDHGWLKTSHTFSFADYHDPSHIHFSHLRVINEDVVEGGQGFGTHPHRDMEIVTYIISGALEHRDSMGNGSIIEAGDVQYMSAGRGVQHSEFNHSPSESVHLLQIWILPETKGGVPLYDQKKFSRESKLGRLRQIVSGDGEDDSIIILQDARIFASILSSGQKVEYSPKPGRKVWIQLISGEMDVNGTTIQAGDGLAISGEPMLSITTTAPESEFLLFDLVG